MKCSEIINKITILECNLEEIECEISDNEEEKEDIEFNIDRLKKLFNSEVEKIDKFTGDDFKDDFIRTSMFSERFIEDRPILNNVFVREKNMVAINGYTLIVVNNNNIPGNLRNKLIKWDTRKDFYKNISQLEPKDFINYDQIIPKDGFKYIIDNVTAETFNETFKVSEIESTYIMLKMNYKDFTIFAQKDYINAAFKALGDEIFTVKFIDSLSPLIFQNEHMLILILPIKMHEEK